MKDILNARFYAILIAESSDAITLEHEALHLLLLSSNGVPVPKCLSAETPEHGHADSVKQFIQNSVQRIGITPPRRFQHRWFPVNIAKFNVFSRERLKPYYFVNLNIITSHIFPEILIEIPCYK